MEPQLRVNMKDLLKFLGLTPEAAALKIGVAASTVYRWKASGSIPVSCRLTLIGLLAVMGKPINSLGDYTSAVQPPSEDPADW
jgi:hypothetical protein